MESEALPSLRVLVVDDEPEIRELVGEYLSARGHQPSLSEDGQVALQQLLVQPFDVVLTDVRMPVMEGVDLLHEITRLFAGGRTSPGGQRPGVVVMSGFPTVETAIEALKLGASDYLLKPFRLKEVHDALLRAVERTRLEREVERLQRAAELYEAAAVLREGASLPLFYEKLLLAAARETGATAAALWADQGGAWTQVARFGPAAPLAHLSPRALRSPQVAGDVAAVPLPGGVLAVAGGRPAAPHLPNLERLAAAAGAALARLA